MAIRRQFILLSPYNKQFTYGRPPQSSPPANKNQIIMEESKEKQAMHRFLQFAIYLSVALDILMFIYAEKVVVSPSSERFY